MNKEILTAAVGGIDERYVIEAESVSVKRPKWAIFAGAAAACLALVFAVGLMINGSLANKPDKYADLPKLELGYSSEVAGPGKIYAPEFAIPEDAKPTVTEQTVYKETPIVASEELVIRLARLFGSDSTEVKRDEDHNRLSLRDGNVFVFCTPGNISADLISGKEGRYTEQYLDDAEYIRIAWEFLESTGIDLSGWSVEDARVHKNGLTYKGDDDPGDPDGWSYYGFMEVYFNHVPIDGIAKIERTNARVELDPDGTVIAFGCGLHSFTEPNEYPLMTVDEVIELYLEEFSDDAPARESVVFAHGSYREGCVVTEVSLAYMIIPEYGDGTLADENAAGWLVPVYVFRGTDPDGDGFTIITRAVPEEYISVRPWLIG